MGHRNEDDDAEGYENLQFPAGGDSVDEGPDAAELGPESVDLVRCPRCRKWVYEEAVRCPCCKTALTPGEDLTRKPRWFVVTTIVILIVITLFWVLGLRVPGLF